MKARRQQAILELVRANRCGSQHDIRDRLAAMGIEATQSTISRDIEELGLARIHDHAGVRYVIPGETSKNGHRQSLRHLLREFAVSMTPSGNLLVIATPPGAAHLLAEGIDQVPFDDIAGTVAGDNTIMVVARDGVPAATVQKALTALMEENGS